MNIYIYTYIYNTIQYCTYIYNILILMFNSYMNMVAYRSIEHILEVWQVDVHLPEHVIQVFIYTECVCVQIIHTYSTLYIFVSALNIVELWHVPLFQWIGLRENLQDSPIFNGKIYGFL